MSSVLVDNRLDVQVKALESSSAAGAIYAVPHVVREMPSNGFFRALLLSFGIMIPFWGGLIWLGLRLLQFS